jgi:UDP-2-acetamido-3-amino-2,3-dideoxy-glucuronate N-acetyltransferase
VKRPANEAPHRLIDHVSFGADVVVQAFVNLYGCRIGAGTRIGTFVEVQRGAHIGERCKVQSHTFICDGVRIGDGVFVGHGVTFVNDLRPRATNARGELQGDGDWGLCETVVENGASIGSGATILGGIRIGADALVGAGAVVTKDVAPGTTVAGNPALPLGARVLEDGAEALDPGAELVHELEPADVVVARVGEVGAVRQVDRKEHL